MSLRDEGPSGRLMRALAAAAPAAEFLDVLAGALPEVAPGQLWRARRGARSLMVLITAVDGAMVEVSPVTVDSGSTEDAVDLPASVSAIGAPLTVWRHLTSPVPTRTLEQFDGDLLIDFAGGDVLEGVVKAGRTGQVTVSPTDVARVVAARTLDAVRELAAAPLPTGSGQLAYLLRDAHVELGVLGRLLALTTSAAMDVARGRRPISADQAEALAPVVGVGTDELLAANPSPPPALLTWMSSPSQRSKLIRLAKKWHRDEDSAFSHATFSVYALAARAYGDRHGDAAWAALGQQYFEAALDDA